MNTRGVRICVPVLNRINIQPPEVPARGHVCIHPVRPVTLVPAICSSILPNEWTSMSNTKEEPPEPSQIFSSCQNIYPASRSGIEFDELISRESIPTKHSLQVSCPAHEKQLWQVANVEAHTIGLPDPSFFIFHDFQSRHGLYLGFRISLHLKDFNITKALGKFNLS